MRRKRPLFQRLTIIYISITLIWMSNGQVKAKAKHQSSINEMRKTRSDGRHENSFSSTLPKNSVNTSKTFYHFKNYVDIAHSNILLSRNRINGNNSSVHKKPILYFPLERISQHQINTTLPLTANSVSVNQNKMDYISKVHLLAPLRNSNTILSSRNHTARRKRKAEPQLEKFFAEQLAPHNLREQDVSNHIVASSKDRSHISALPGISDSVKVQGGRDTIDAHSTNHVGVRRDFLPGTLQNERIATGMEDNIDSNRGSFESNNIQGHELLRQRLLNALERRIKEQNMIMHDRNSIGESNLADNEHVTPFPLTPRYQREQWNGFPMEANMRRTTPPNRRFSTIPFSSQNVAHDGDFPLQGELGKSYVPENNFMFPKQEVMFPDKDFEEQAHHIEPNTETIASHGSELPFSRLLSGNSDFVPERVPNERMLTRPMGNLGDEVVPTIGSLGDSFVPFGNIHGDDTENMFPQLNQGPEEVTDFLPSQRLIRHHKNKKKTWVTDVNVYSKKKDDDMNQFFSDDDDPTDEFDPCESSPCHNRGICKVIGSVDHICVCPRTFKGKHCQTRNHCHPNPCKHGSKCTETISGFKCSCEVGYKGTRCEERNFCLPNPCLNNGVCTESGASDRFSCTCSHGFYGKICDQRKTTCQPNPCQNYAKCITDGTECICGPGTSGKLCQEGHVDMNSHGDAFTNSFHVGERTENAMIKSDITHPTPVKSDVETQLVCDAGPCLNGGTCHHSSSSERGYICECAKEYSGTYCEDKKCKCENGGTCVGEGIEVKCSCKPGYGGTDCQEHTRCNENTCMHNGICIEKIGGFRCRCEKGYKGQRCEEFDKCSPNPCLHNGVCQDYGDFYKCECKRGFKGKQCEEIDFCLPNPCKNDAQCFGYLDGFQCECSAGFSGKLCEHQLHCLSNPCSNGAECIEVMSTVDHPDSSYKCGCKLGFMGTNCDERDFCHSSPCRNGGRCTNTKDGFICSCSDKFKGRQCEYTNHCYGNPCKNNGKCTSTVHDFKCECVEGYKGLMCDEIDYCKPNPCKNSGYCMSNQGENGFLCQCSRGYKGATCADVDPCYPNPCAHGECSELAGGYLCNCTLGFKGPQCSEIDHCQPNPCFHGGFCQPINGGSGFVCECVVGYKGQLCQDKDFCHPNPCKHHGVCKELQPYSRDGIDVRQMYSSNYNDHVNNRVECKCEKGFKGPYCDEIDQCYPNPCLHESTCIPEGKTSTKCNCSLGWKGEHCELTDLCSPDPCKYGTHCLQTDEESYQCVKNLCTPTPCHNGGKCIVVNDESYECACQRGWKGKNCIEADSCIPNPCSNNGVCHNVNGGGFTCECPKNFSGGKCEVESKRNEGSLQSNNSINEDSHLQFAHNFCSTHPCKNGGTCLKTDGAFTCRCKMGFSGPFCDDNVCNPTACANGGTCVPYYGIALCKCTPEYTGAHCSDHSTDIQLSPDRKTIYIPTASFLIDEFKKLPEFVAAHLKQPDYIDQAAVVKSFTPHVENTQKKNDVNALSLAQRVEEILNSDREISPKSLPSSQISSNSESDDFLKDLEAKITPETTPNDLLPPPPSKIVLTVSPKEKPVELSTNINKPQLRSESPPKEVSVQEQIQKSLSQQFASASANEDIKLQQQSASQSPLLQGSPLTLLTPEKTLKIIEQAKDPCNPNICSNGGTCVVRTNGVPECICKDGFSGPKCEFTGAMGYSSAPKFFPNDECDHCDEHAVCVNGHCICDTNYVGDGLECWPSTPFDKEWTCAVNPCQNGGTCKPGRAKCVCRLGYIGTYCETYCPPAVHLSFDGLKPSLREAMVKDESGNNNFAIMKNGVQVVPSGGKCDGAVSLNGGDILFDGLRFYPKPYGSVTMAVWIKLDTNLGIQSVFDTVGGRASTHREGQYHLEVDNGRVRWFHRNERHVTIFSILTKPLIETGNWTHLAVTYDGVLGMARVYINGDLVGSDTNTSAAYKYLSQDWETKAGIGKHEHEFGNRLLRGMVDEFYMFDCPLPRLEILVLMHHCKIYWKNSKKETKPSAVVTQNGPLNKIVQSDVRNLDVMSIPEQVMANARKNKGQYQNYYGFVGIEPKLLKIIDEKNMHLHYNKPQPSKIVTTTNRFSIEKLHPSSQPTAATSRFSIEKPQDSDFIPREEYDIFKGQNQMHIDIYQPRNNIPDSVNYMHVMPAGPTALYGEVKDLIGHNGFSGKRTDIEPSVNKIKTNLPQPFQARPNLNLNHRAPVIRNENRELPLAPKAYLDAIRSLGVDMAASAKSNLPNPYQKYAMILSPVESTVKVAGPSELNHVFKKGPVVKPKSLQVSPKLEAPLTNQNDPKWFQWQKGLAQVQGGTYTNTHSNTLQRNDPGSVNANTHVQSSQNSKGGTQIKQRQFPTFLQQNMNYIDPRWFQWQKGLAQVQGGTYTNTHSNTLQRNDPGSVNANTHVQSSQNSKGGTQIKQRTNPPIPAAASNPSNAAAFFASLMSRNSLPDKKQVHTTTHNHQWGYGNGQGNGQGIGTPSASGSGGGWGAGGPLNQQMSLPGWSGNPSNGPPWGEKAQEAQQQAQQQGAPPQQRAIFQASSNLNRQVPPNLPPNARSIWNTYLLQKALKRKTWLSMQQKRPSSVLSQHFAKQLQSNGNLPYEASSLGPISLKSKYSVAQDKRSEIPPRATYVLPFLDIRSLLQKKQSQSDMHTDATNIAESSVQINPASGGSNMKVAQHTWGYGNGNGEGNGVGSPGGQGQGGGWGAGGPTKQNTWLPGQQSRKDYIRGQLPLPQFSFDKVIGQKGTRFNMATKQQVPFTSPVKKDNRLQMIKSSIPITSTMNYYNSQLHRLNNPELLSYRAYYRDVRSTFPDFLRTNIPVTYTSLSYPFLDQNVNSKRTFPNYTQGTLATSPAPSGQAISKLNKVYHSNSSIVNKHSHKKENKHFQSFKKSTSVQKKSRQRVKKREMQKRRLAPR